MTNFKRKKKKRRKDGWSSSGRLHKHEKRMLDEDTRNRTKRTKIKRIGILARYKGTTWKWWTKKDWFVRARYEKMKDAENAIRILTKNKQNKHYEFRIGE